MRTQVTLFLIVFLILVFGALGVFLIVNYNGLVKAEKAVDEAQAQIATVCQRRLDLLPNLIETVKAYAQHEKSTLTAVIAARSNAKGVLDEIMKAKGGFTKEDIAKFEASQAEVTSAFRGIFALMENYPNLRASSNFMALQDQFEGTENRIAVARQRYNAAARQFNTIIETFPGVFLAPMFGFEERIYFEAKKQAYEPVKAEF